MSTVPHHAAGAANAEVPPSMAAPGGSDFKAAIEDFITTADALGAPRPASEDLTKMTYQSAGFARELFPGKLAVQTSVDPEMRNDVCLLFQVDAAGTVEKILALEDVWLRRVVSIAPRWSGLFRLSIDAH
jgi:hypothetical protein